MRHMPASARARRSAMSTHCSSASSSSMPLTFSPGFSGRLRRPSFCLLVRCCASSCITVMVCFVASTQMHFCAATGNSRMQRTSARATTVSSLEPRSLRSEVFSFLASGSGSSVGRFLALTRSGMMTRLSGRKDFRSLLSRSTIHRSPCQLTTSPSCPLYFAAPVRPTTATWLPGSSSAGFRLAGRRESCWPERLTTVTLSALSGFGPRETQYSSLSSGFAARPVI
mmetsp:Transcript_112997/g.364832  ORF Transcript_112997/g.364832 Transcript_112997/m.364832 type:complete len:226 (+) Transcript_112997:159-836(+)